MPTVTANGLSIGYEVIGEGPPLIALHGATLSGRGGLEPHVARLIARFQLYLPDARGHGATRWDVDRGFTTVDLVADVLAFADAVRLEVFHLLGFSMGAMTALKLAAEHVQRVRTLVLVGISPEREPRASVARRFMDPARIERDDPSWAAALAVRHEPTQGAGAWRRLLPAIAADVEEQPLLTAQDLRGVTAPTLVVAGDRDPFVPVGQAWQLARTLADARLLIVPGAGHDVMIERPAVFAAALDAFYDEEDPR